MTIKSPAKVPIPALWVQLLAIGLPAGLVLWLYWISAAPGLTWANNGSDGGDLLAAAAVNGVPHPSGYPLYTHLLRSWIWVGHLLNPQVDNAFWGNRFSALCVVGAVAFLAATVASLLATNPQRWLWGGLAALAFAIAPLAWSQALITEVYGLHALLIAAMGWLVLSQLYVDPDTGIAPSRTTGNKNSSDIGIDIATGCLMGLGAAHHLTSVLLWPALFYWRFQSLARPSKTNLQQMSKVQISKVWLASGLRILSSALLVALAFYALLMWRVASASQPLAIAWGYPRDLAGLWWLVSGEAYRSYVFGMSLLDFGGRLASLASLLVEQFTAFGLALVIIGLAVWDRSRPILRNGALLWILPISLYTAGYNTVDSYVYLIPVVWLMALMLGQGLATCSDWIARALQGGIDRNASTASSGKGEKATTTGANGSRSIRATAMVAFLALGGVAFLLFWRFPQTTLIHDHEAQDFLIAAESTLEPNSLVISNADAPTFALWYGEWGSAPKNELATGNGRLAQAAPGLILVNYALYQFGWYRDLMHDLYPDVPNMGDSFDELLKSNRSLRPVFFTEPLTGVTSFELSPVGIFWRLE